MGNKGRGPGEAVIHPGFHISLGTFLSYEKVAVQNELAIQSGSKFIYIH